MGTAIKGDQIKDGTVTSTDVDSTIATTAAVTARAGSQGSVQWRNRIINGNFDLWQRGTSFTDVSLGKSGGKLTYTADRWFGYRTGMVSGLSVSRLSGTASDYALYSAYVNRASGNSDTSTMYFYQIIDAYDCQDLSGKTITISFKARNFAPSTSSTLTVFCVRGGTYGGSSWDLSQGTWTNFQSQSAAKTLTTSWQTFSETFTIGSGATQTIAVGFAYTPTGTSAGNDGYLVTSVQFELGAVASQFEREDFNTTLRRCQRHFFTTFPLGTTPASATGSTNAINYVTPTNNSQYMGADCRLPERMRSNPTVVTYNPFTAGSGWGDTSDVTQNYTASVPSGGEASIWVQNDSMVSNHPRRCVIHLTAEAEL